MRSGASLYANGWTIDRDEESSPVAIDFEGNSWPCHFDRIAKKILGLDADQWVPLFTYNPTNYPPTNADAVFVLENLLKKGFVDWPEKSLGMFD